jgi:2-polyprenyl-3-methyl-5-hydroxy-6-metoxy-1,4-benzoquinol methylase
MDAQVAIDRENAAFWNEICGSQLARQLGVITNDRPSLQRFDDWFFAFYPYLDQMIDFTKAAGKEVLEVGLGFGSVSQRLAESGAKLTGLDIAAGPVAGVNHRLKQSNLPGRALQGSILAAPFPNRSFDVVVAIGCFHHTGNLEGAVSEAARLLRYHGRATLMTYSATAYTRWLRYPLSTARYILSVWTGDPKPLELSSEERALYDIDSEGTPAPATVLLSPSHFRRILSRYFGVVSVRGFNASSHLRGRLPRSVMLQTVGRIAPLDLYAQVAQPLDD